MIETAMILVAGKGTRMRAAPDDPPKPLTLLAGQSLLARMMVRLEAAGIKRVVLNIHHKAQAIAAFAEAYDGAAEIILSDERDALLETGGGVKKALPLLGDKPFLVANGDVVWREEKPVLEAFLSAFDASAMTAQLMLADMASAIGYDGAGDYHLANDARLSRKTGQEAAYIFAGVQILSPSLFDNMPDGAFSLNQVYDTAQAQNRLFGHVMDAVWMHVGTPEGVRQAETALANLAK